MAQENCVPFLRTWFLKQEIDAICRDADENDDLIQQMIQAVMPEQQQRLCAIRQSGPWDAQWENAVRQQKELADQVVSRLRRQREVRQRIGILKEKLPPTSASSASAT